MRAHATSNTEKVYKCVHCGSSFTNIVREGSDPRLKCNDCNGMFDASNSLAADEAGLIPDEKQEPQQATQEYANDALSNPRAVVGEEVVREREPETPVARRVSENLKRIPRSPKYVLMSKDKKHIDYSTQKDLKKTLLAWEAKERNYDLFELKLRKADVKVDLED